VSVTCVILSNPDNCRLNGGGYGTTAKYWPKMILAMGNNRGMQGVIGIGCENLDIHRCKADVCGSSLLLTRLQSIHTLAAR